MSSNLPIYTVLSGGVGGAKLVVGLQQVLQPEQLQVIANTGDDFEHLGLPICPDIDTLLYTLANAVNPDTGWGLANESWNCMDQLEKLGGEAWFRLGDKDLATHLLRRQLLSSGMSLSDVTAALREKLGVAINVWPMADAASPTEIETSDGMLAFQDYFVRLRAEPVAQQIHYGAAPAAPQALAALANPDLAAVIISPSNPWLSIDPILAIDAIKHRIQAVSAPVIAVSPIVNGKAIKGPTAKLMREAGIEPSVTNITRHYREIVDALVIDTQDAEHQAAIEDMGIKVKITNTVMTCLEDKQSLASEVLQFASELAAETTA
jgi:LPPG:FO 2-phospho-L-lactate transferase